MCLQLLVALQEAYGLGGGMLSVLSSPCGLHSGNAGFKFFGLSNQFVDQAVNAVRQKLDRLESLFVGFGKVNDVSVNRFVAGEATGIKDRSLQIVDVERCDFFGKFGASRTEMVDQSIGRNAQHGACRSWRISVDGLSFVENLCDIFRHVFVWFDSLRLEQNNFAVLPVAVSAASRATANGSLAVLKEVGKETEANAFVRIVRITRSAQVLQRYIGTNRFQNREGFLPTLNTATRALTGELK